MQIIYVKVWIYPCWYLGCGHNYHNVDVIFLARRGQKYTIIRLWWLFITSTKETHLARFFASQNISRFPLKKNINTAFIHRYSFFSLFLRLTLKKHFDFIIIYICMDAKTKFYSASLELRNSVFIILMTKNF